jgi:hypothetical protein
MAIMLWCNKTAISGIKRALIMVFEDRYWPGPLDGWFSEMLNPLYANKDASPKLNKLIVRVMSDDA